MKQQNLYVSKCGNIQLRHLLCAVMLCSFLPACKTKAEMRSSAPVQQCIQTRTANIPDWPSDWVAEGASFAIRLLGIITEDRKLTVKEHGCLKRIDEINATGESPQGD